MRLQLAGSSSAQQSGPRLRMTWAVGAAQTGPTAGGAWARATPAPTNRAVTEPRNPFLMVAPVGRFIVVRARPEAIGLQTGEPRKGREMEIPAFAFIGRVF